MSLTVEEVRADRGELSDPGFRASPDAEVLEMEPAVRSSIPISPRIVETCINRKSKAPTSQSKTAIPLSGKPTLTTFKNARKGILENPAQDNMFTGNQVPTPIIPVGGLVPKGRERNFRVRPQENVHPVNSMEGKVSASPKLNHFPLLPPT